MDQNLKLSDVIKLVGSEKGIDRNTLIDTLETAIATAAKRVYGTEREIEAQYNEDIDEIELFQIIQVVDEVVQPLREITPDDVEEYQEFLGEPLPQLGEEVLFQIFYRDEDRRLAEEQDRKVGDLLQLESAKYNFGRIAAQTAKQVIITRMRDAEQDIIYNRYKDREGTLVSGKVRRFEKGNIIVSIENETIDAILPQREQMPRENVRMGDTIEAYVKKVQRSSKEPQIVLSRTAPEFVLELFKRAVPEMRDDIVQILRVARQPGIRTKVAVYSSQSEVDPVGACVGPRGQRVQSIVEDLHGEKIDIVPFHDDAARFVCSAISPAEVSKVFIDDTQTSMELIVPNDQLSLAIGRGGQNVRLAAQLTGWNLDIISESRLNELKNEAKRQLLTNSDIPESIIDTLFTLGYNKLEHIAKVDPLELSQIPGFGVENAEKVVAEAQHILCITQRAERDKERKDQDVSDITTYLGITERQAKQIYGGGYHNLTMLFVEGNAKRLDARTGIGTNLATGLIKNLTELALGQEVYESESDLENARAIFDEAMQNPMTPIEEAYAKTVDECGEKVFPVDDWDDDPRGEYSVKADDEDEV